MERNPTGQIQEAVEVNLRKVAYRNLAALIDYDSDFRPSHIAPALLCTQPLWLDWYPDVTLLLRPSLKPLSWGTRLSGNALAQRAASTSRGGLQDEGFYDMSIEVETAEGVSLCSSQGCDTNSKFQLISGNYRICWLGASSDWQYAGSHVDKDQSKGRKAFFADSNVQPLSRISQQPPTSQTEVVLSTDEAADWLHPGNILFQRDSFREGFLREVAEAARGCLPEPSNLSITFNEYICWPVIRCPRGTAQLPGTVLCRWMQRCQSSSEDLPGHRPCLWSGAPFMPFGLADVCADFDSGYLPAFPLSLASTLLPGTHSPTPSAVLWQGLVCLPTGKVHTPPVDSS
ncbi:hypothetical protein E5288_WYG011300 [Bos mutus]|uniref:Uncharacterized protein n=1 Tax=Bos mutus TaxID=72004 RepID=A0A6B0R8Z5_9CETA|nr:hypothetical protein [Bos mutus]